jgi:hypothetical protein
VFDYSELLVLQISDLMVMRVEFPIEFENLFEGVRDNLKRDLHFKIQVIRNNELENAKKNGGLSSQIANHLLGDI